MEIFLSGVTDPHHVDVIRVHFHADPDADPDPTFHSDADPDPTFKFNAGPDPTTHLFPDLDPPMLQNDRPSKASTFSL
jgi:hypothetical protein